jgi:hypothetical protein
MPNEEDPVSELEIECDIDRKGPLPPFKLRLRLPENDMAKVAIGTAIGVLATLGILEIM